MIQRLLKNQVIQNHKNGFINIIYGPRRVGKTTLCNQIIEEMPDLNWFKANGDDIRDRDYLSVPSLSNLLTIIGSANAIFIDEAQRIPNIGLSLKLLIDNNPQLFILITGSSSIDLSNGIHEPLTGRNQKYKLYPLSIKEILQAKRFIDVLSELNSYLRFGSYPYIFSLATEDDKRKYLLSIVEDYLYRDLKDLANIETFDNLQKLTTLLAFQVGSEVSHNELSVTLGVDAKTIKKYISLLKKAFIIFEIPSFSRNLRNELNKSKKYFFWDLGVRNAVINQFQDLNSRNDSGVLWENFVALERKKQNEYSGNLVNYYFWRTYKGAEIDWIEEKDGELEAFEFKFSKRKVRTPKAFLETYNTEQKIINKENFLQYFG